MASFSSFSSMALIESATLRLPFSKLVTMASMRSPTAKRSARCSERSRERSRLADEGAQRVAFAERHFDAAGRHVHHFDGDDLALAEIGVAHRVGLHLLDAERDAFLVDVDVEHLGLDHVALVVAGERFFALRVPGDVGEVHHAVEFRREADEQAELGDVLDLALDDRADRMGAQERVPRIGLHLLDAQRNPPLLAIDIDAPARPLPGWWREFSRDADFSWSSSFPRRGPGPRRRLPVLRTRRNR